MQFQPAITSVQNPRIKEAAKLRERRQRKKQQRFLIDGARELDRAMSAGVDLREVFVCEPLCGSLDSQRLVRRLVRERTKLAPVCEVISVTPDVLAKLAFGDRLEGIIGVAETIEPTLDALKLPPRPLVAVLEGVEKPGNIGAVLRSADAAGVDALIVADAGTDLYNPNTIRASLGTLFSVPCCVAGAEETLAWLRAGGFKIFAARLDGAGDYAAADYRGATAIVLGNEAQGLMPAWSTPEVHGIRLPMRGIADSLNVSATAAVLFYEALRQRGNRGE